MSKPKRPSSSHFKVGLVVAALSAMPLSADAASLGRLSVWSTLGQPLRAEVEVTATPEEQGTLVARIASTETYRQAGLDYSPSLSSLRVTVDRRGSRPIIRISSEQPMKEAFIDILIELSWSNGRLSREYTLLLDPVDMGSPGGKGGLAPPVGLPGLPPRLEGAV